jgi:Na+-transporting NADH:ubiquinone oxidoreductase subunit NqrC
MEHLESQESSQKLLKRTPKKNNGHEEIIEKTGLDGLNRPHWIWFLLVGLLVIQIILSAYSVVMSQVQYQQSITHRNEVIRSVASYTANLDALSNKMLADYKNDVYSNPNVDTTAKQQVMGTEHNFNAIMLLIKQNSRLMEVLAQMN